MTKREKFIILLDSEQLHAGDVIIILEGDGLSRYKKAVELYKMGIAHKICFSGNFDDKKSGAVTFEIIKPLLLEEDIPEDDLIFEDKSKNTYEQAVEIMKLSKHYCWNHIIIVASQYHSYRAFLTFLHEQKIQRPDLIMDMASVTDLDWYKDTGYGRRIDLLQLELNKIDLYQKNGNVSDYEEGIDYLEWKYTERKK